MNWEELVKALREQPLGMDEQAWEELVKALREQPLGMDEQASVVRLRAALRKKLATLPDPRQYALWHAFLRLAQVGVFVAIAALAMAVGWSVSDAPNHRDGRDDLASVLMRDNLEEGP